MLGIRGTDVDPVADQVRLVTLKRRKEVHRVVPLPADLAGYLRAFGTSRAFPISRIHAWRLVSKELAALGVDPDACSPRGLRHGHAVNAVNHGAPLNVIQAALGHANLATTSIYLAVTGKDIAAGYAGVQW